MASEIFSVGSFNAHSGVDGWAHPYDLEGALRAIDADITVVPEAWTPQTQPHILDDIARSLDATVRLVALGKGVRCLPDPKRSDTWGPSFDWRHRRRALHITERREIDPKTKESPRLKGGLYGVMSLAIFSKLPVIRTETIALPPRKRDHLHRSLLSLTVAVGERRVEVVGMHMPHIRHGSPFSFRALNATMNERGAQHGVVIAGDANMWGPPLSLLLPSWRRAVKGRTWPATHPHSQIDHILYNEFLECISGSVMGPLGSDHRAVRALFRLKE